ncbi:MAG: VIT1/CCC1 transporter family protein [Candidatus Omnitrophica bacterium]|nr:VIT1/CCC1 transporter family protein [Candidatus Omnitrophota bacterium]
MNDAAIKSRIEVFQKNEITEYHIYRILSRSTRDRNNSEVLARIAQDELRHYGVWRELTGKEVNPDRFKIWFYVVIAKLFGLTFGVKLLEKGEDQASVVYKELGPLVPDALLIAEDEDRHERELIALINEERLAYVGSIVLGLNDALVELTGCLAGLTFALQNTRVVAVAGVITGIAAALSMAASEYLSTRSESGDRSKNALKASVYTGIAYIFTVFYLVFPYLVFANIYVCLLATLLNAVTVIWIFTFYISVAKDMDFMKRFGEMISISMGVALLSFLIGLLVRKFLSIDA